MSARLVPRPTTTGLTIFCVVPTTLGVSVALVRSCKGNEGVALVMVMGELFSHTTTACDHTPQHSMQHSAASSAAHDGHCCLVPTQAPLLCGLL